MNVLPRALSHSIADGPTLLLVLKVEQSVLKRQEFFSRLQEVFGLLEGILVPKKLKMKGFSQRFRRG
ncbi:hypothetical protein [Bryobacter aggregatus]|uniref:hypothetical protein n=1 Tax=Bryobacter aggregatus TaxID=360054 RepID=UPI001EE264A3|nr:hypothetical protein [Bryobacter aggregatus]